MRIASPEQANTGQERVPMAHHSITHTTTDEHAQHSSPETHTPHLTDGLPSLLALTRRLADLLAPVRPRAEFRAELQHSLLASARQQQAKRLLALPTYAAAAPTPAAADPSRIPGWSSLDGIVGDKRWVWGAAAAGSAVSLVSILTYVVRRQHHRPAASA